MSEPYHLSIFAQLLLSNDSKVVESAAELLRGLVECNLTANNKLYLTGVFYFACRFTGNNFSALAWLFHVTHLKQSFHDSAASVAREVSVPIRSILGNLLPAAMITSLHNYGPDRYLIFLYFLLYLELFLIRFHYFILDFQLFLQEILIHQRYFC
jgi:hypothetical protein